MRVLIEKDPRSCYAEGVNKSTDGRSGQSHGDGLSSSQVEGEVVSIALVHHFHAQASTVQDVSPGWDDSVLTVNQRLVEVETVQVEGHCGNAESGKPNTHDGPSCEKEVERTRVVEAGVLEDETTKVPVCRNNVVGFFFLTELVSVVLGFIFSSFTDQ